MSRSKADADVFQVIADPTRRAILDLLLPGELSVSQIAAAFACSLSAVSQHIKILREAGLVEVRHAGRERLYRLNAASLHEVYDWSSHYETFWREKLGALERYLEENE